MKNHLALTCAALSIVAVLAWGQGTQSSQTSQSQQTSQSGTGKATASSSSSASSSNSGGQRAFSSGGGSARSLERPTHAVFFRLVREESGSKALIDAHHEYLMLLAKQGVVLLSGPWRDEPGEMTLIRVKDDESARNFVSADPGVKSGSLSAEAKPWSPNIVALSAGKGN